MISNPDSDIPLILPLNIFLLIYNYATFLLCKIRYIFIPYRRLVSVKQLFVPFIEIINLPETLACVEIFPVIIFSEADQGYPD